MSKRKTNKKNKELLRVLRTAEITSIAIGFCWLFFYFILSIKGGWDDINIIWVMGAPLLACIALVIAFVRMHIARLGGKVIMPPLVLLWTSALFFCVAAVVKTTMILAA